MNTANTLQALPRHPQLGHSDPVFVCVNERKENLNPYSRLLVVGIGPTHRKNRSRCHGSISVFLSNARVPGVFCFILGRQHQVGPRINVMGSGPSPGLLQHSCFPLGGGSTHDAASCLKSIKVLDKQSMRGQICQTPRWTIMPDQPQPTRAGGRVRW